MVKCSNCHCDIDQSKMFLHERFCFQNIKYCEICQEGIIKEEFEEHCENHKKNSNELKKLDSEEDRNSRSLKRVESSKVLLGNLGTNTITFAYLHNSVA